MLSERSKTGVMNTVFKSGQLFISSRGIGWKSWRKRWFILTRTSLVFFKNDPSALSQRGGEVNLTLGGIDLNNSGSVVVREDKKLLTVLFPDGRDGRAFTLKAESSEDLFEWKTALEHALAQAPSAALVMGHNGIFQNEADNTTDESFQRYKRPAKSMVVERPILLALEDIDGGPSFLEKALRFLEEFGIKIEGILRQSADVEDVYRRVQEYEQGRNQFSFDEDAHVVGDCVKYALRELPSSPVPASCCISLLEASRIEQKESQLNAFRSAIFETFPEPNRRLLQRILKMMHIVASHASENRMTPSALAACMAPLLLRPLLAGECELEEDFAMSDISAQLLAAANAANNAQAIVAILLEDYDKIFNDDNLHRCSSSADSQTGNGASEGSTDGENLYVKSGGYHDAENDVDPEAFDDPERAHSGKFSERSGYAGSDLYRHKGSEGDGGSDIESIGETNGISNHKSLRGSNFHLNDQDICKKESESPIPETHTLNSLPYGKPNQSMSDLLSPKEQGLHVPIAGPHLHAEKSTSKLASYSFNAKRPSFWGKNNARKNLSVESFDSSGEEELAIQRLETTKNDLRNRIAKEANGNAVLQASLERRKQALHERRLALEHDVSRLQEQLQAERDLRADLEIGLSMSPGQFFNSRGMNPKTRAELEEIALAEADVARLKQKVTELHLQLNQQSQNHYGTLSDASDHYQHLQNLHSQQKVLQQNFDTTVAFCNHEATQRTEESSLGADRRNMKEQVFLSATNSKQLFLKLYGESASLSNSKSTEASTSFSADEFSAVDSASAPSTSRPIEATEYPRHHPSVPSSTLVELTTRLDFFKDRRNQLMEQLHNLDASFATSTCQNLVYKQQPSFPPPK